MQYNYYSIQHRIILGLSLLFIIISLGIFFAMSVYYRYSLIEIVFQGLIFIIIIVSIFFVYYNYGNKSSFILNEEKRIICRKRCFSNIVFNYKMSPKDNVYYIDDINVKNKIIKIIDKNNNLYNQKINDISISCLLSIIPKEYLKNAIIIYSNPIEDKNNFYFPDAYYIFNSIDRRTSYLRNI